MVRPRISQQHALRFFLFSPTAMGRDATQTTYGQGKLEAFYLSVLCA
jgi:hypothetical protein